MKPIKKIMKQQNNSKSCKLVEKQVNKWLASLQPTTKRNYKDTALEIGLPIDGSIL